jgi:hypothetical protein
MRRDRDPTETGSADVAANSGQNWNSSPAALRWSVAGLLDLNSRSQLRGNGGQMVTRHKNADRTTNIAGCIHDDTDSAYCAGTTALLWSGGSGK